MGNSCSSGQAHKDKDNASQHSEESPSYQVTLKKPSTDAAASAAAAAEGASAEGAEAAGALLGPSASFRDSKKAGLSKVLRGVASSSISDSMSLSSPVAAQSPRELEPALVPPSVAALGEEARAALLGRLPRARSRSRALVLYVCAADSQDCCLEKGALHARVAPALRVRARRHGRRLHVADLHWRSELEQQRDHRFPELCTAELARQCELASVVPMVFLNAGLGTPLLPHTLDSADFKAALEAAGSDEDKQLLNKWYSMDTGATPPCYRLARAAPARWRREMARALAVLVRTLSQEARDAYLTTVVEQEVHNTVLMSQEQARRCIWVCRTGMAGGSPVTPDTDEEPDDEAADAPGHHELQRRLANLQRDLKQHLSEKHIVRASVRAAGSSAEYEEGVRAALDERLGAVLDALVADDVGTRAAQGVPASLFEELNEQLAFCQKAAQCTANREITLNEIKTYICGESTRPLVLVGSSGCGKAALVARAAHLCPTWLPDAAVIIRFVGLTAHSSSSHPLLKSIVDQCSVLHNGSVYRGRNDVPSLTAELTRVLGALGRRRPAVLAVVGAGGLRGARWLPHLLPDNVKMLITVTEEQDDPSSSAILAVLSDGAGGGPNMARAPPPAPAEARAVLAACGAQYARAAPAPPAALQAVHNLTLPLYAKILAWQISLPAETFSEHADPESMMELKISADLEGQLSQLLATAEAALGAARVRVCLAVLTVSRRGLDDTEILDILAQDELFRSDKTYLSWAPAALFWPQLAHLLGAFLRWDGRGRVRWRDVAVQRAAHDRYYPDHEHHARTTLVNYFEGVWFKENDPKMAGRLISQDNKFSDECYNNRKLDELPYQHYHLTKSDPVSFANRPYFTDHSWIYDKIAATDSGHLLEDIELIHLDPLPEHIAVLQEFIQVYSFALDYDVRQFYSLLRFYLEQRIKDGRELKSDICKGWLAAARNPPIPTLIATNVEAKIERDLPRRELSATDGFDSKTYDLVVRLEKCSRYVATLSTEREEICVWDAVRCMKVRVLLGVTHPINLVPIDQYKCIVLCRRELRVYDLNQGTFLLTLKGVMNQKMPYYGLHDEQHLVCLSRNRMYVNLMHVGTGDCVTTFKAGEDRFLNSLLVSGDGRILVCGDETQKPFPLLVWSLTSRKLLYDLRIPHHDFVTSLAAITHEGSYVCVVARELDEPAPNFIVVYDLQSGTLFKKWKPGCDTAALAISSADGCVVSGLEDTRILVWDLVTGNCRFTLWGHTAAPGLLRLARAGAVLLSADHKSRDLSVSLWDLNAGKLIAIYTPPERITSCEVLSGGSIIPLTLENHKMLVTLKLEGPTPEAVLNAQEPYEECYGDAENEGKVFDLRDKEGNGNC